ncbi:MAG: CocE/NonD family hydrolase [Acidobacteriaceae bacterium]|nr:CocE/NonD family hydrolase [Acidobacteriaceae bacterium]
MLWTFSVLLPAVAPAQTNPPNNLAFIRENYSKYEYRVPARDGAKLFVSVYVPKDAFTSDRKYPIMMSRTPYSVAPYGPDRYRDNLGPSEHFLREKFIFVYEDVRGRYMSEGESTQLRPHRANKTNARDTDESTDTYDTIEWLIHHVPGCSGKVGMWGISQPGFYASAGMIDAHPALVAVSPQAPVTDYYLGDDVYHNGAFMLAANFGFYQFFRPRQGDPAPPAAAQPFDYGTPDGYDFFLNMGSLGNADEKYFKRSNPFWTELIDNASYNRFWQEHSIWKHLSNIKPSVMVVGGWFDAEDLQGPLRTFDFIQKHNPPATSMLVMGPWTHGGFARGDGDRVGNVNFGSKTSAFFREHIEFPFFLHELKGQGDGNFSKAWVFETGVNQWRRFNAWPLRDSASTTLYLNEKGALSSNPSASTGFAEYVSDSNKPVPYIGHTVMGMRADYMTEDQRFAATRPDVLVFQTPVLDHDVSFFGPVAVHLTVSSSATDSDFIVKLIDVYPGNFPDYNAAPTPPGTPPAPQPANAIKMGGYQQLIRGEPFRAKYRNSFEHPEPLEPGKQTPINFKMPDIAHTFRAGHRIMVQIQSSWFPLTDRNPQKFLDIAKALASDFGVATQRIYCGGANGSRIERLDASSGRE